MGKILLRENFPSFEKTYVCKNFCGGLATRRKLCRSHVDSCTKREVYKFCLHAQIEMCTCGSHWLYILRVTFLVSRAGWEGSPYFTCALWPSLPKTLSFSTQSTKGEEKIFSHEDMCQRFWCEFQRNITPGSFCVRPQPITLRRQKGNLIISAPYLFIIYK